MENFQLFHVDHNEYPLLLLILFCHSKVNQREAIKSKLNEIGFEGKILVDNLMQVGVESMRFYVTDFKEDFLDNGYPIVLPIDSIYRKLTCDYLRENNLVEGSSLSTRIIRAIQDGEII